jgi:hypothetical protein
MQVELFNRKRWKTQVELTSAIHDYIELIHNIRRQHSALGMPPRPNTRTYTTQPGPPDSKIPTPFFRG